MATHKLQSVPGIERATRTRIDGRISEPGAYEVSIGRIFRWRIAEVNEGGELETRQCTIEQAERFALAQLADDDVDSVIAHDVLLENADAPAADEPAEELRCICPNDFRAEHWTEDTETHCEECPIVGKDEISPRSCQARLIEDGHDWEVTTERVYVERPDVDPEVMPFDEVTFARAFTRADTKEVLSVQGTAAEPVNNRDALSLLDTEAEAGRIEYVRTLVPYKRRTIGTGRNAVTEWTQDLRKVAMTFKLTGAEYAWQAGGICSTSHDGTTAIHVTARVVVAGMPIYAPSRYATKHTRYVSRRIARSGSIMSHVIDGARDLMALVESVKSMHTEKVDYHTAGLVADLLWPMKKADDKEEQQTENDKRERIVKRLNTRAGKMDRDLGAMRYVLAAAYVGVNETHDSMWTWSTTRRDRITKSLIHLARFAGKLRAGLATKPTTEKKEVA